MQKRAGSALKVGFPLRKLPNARSNQSNLFSDHITFNPFKNNALNKI